MRISVIGGSAVPAECYDRAVSLGEGLAARGHDVVCGGRGGVMNGDAVIAVDGGPGTLSELGHALDFGRPVAGLHTHRIDGVEGITHADSPAAAIDAVEAAVAGGR